MSDDPISERDGPTLEEMAQELEEWRTSRKGDHERCQHCGCVLRGRPTDVELITLYGYLLGGQKHAAYIRGVGIQSVKNKMTHLYRRLGIENGMQAAYLLGTGDLTTGGIK